MTYQEAVALAVDAIETLAHGRKIDGITVCPKCDQHAVSFRTNWHGQVYWLSCATHGCIREHRPWLVERKKVALPQTEMGL